MMLIADLGNTEKQEHGWEGETCDSGGGGIELKGIHDQSEHNNNKM